MKRVVLSAAILLATGAFIVIATGAKNTSSAQGTYKIELDNAFGLVNGADFKVAGVRAGTIHSIDLCGYVKHSGCQNPLHALVTVQVTQPGFGSFHSDAFCQSRPQSLIGEYFIDCQPGERGRPLKPGSTIPVTHTESTIPADLIQDVMRMPYRERFTLIINELGAAVAGRSGDLEQALRRAVPALTQTDNLLNLLANDSHTIQQLNVNADAVITALANNSVQVQRFITEADNTATDTATQAKAFQATWQKLPGFLEQLKPSMQQLGTAVDANEPVLANLNSSAAQLNRFLTDVVPFSHSSLPALRSLGQASVTGKQAVTAATPTVKDLNTFAQPTPELAKNLAIVLHDLDDRGRAVEQDPRSPGGKGYTGLEALLQYVFNQAVAINTFGPFGHLLAVDAFVSPTCSPYATPQTIASNLSNPLIGTAATRSCYAWLGPNQPGINEVDPSNPSGCVPDPGAQPPYAPSGAHVTTSVPCKLKASSDSGSPVKLANAAKGASKSSKATRPVASTASRGSPSSAGGSGGSSNPVGHVLGGIFGTLTGAVNGAVGGVRGAVSGATQNATQSASQAASNGTQAQQLLNYLLAP
jgi:phospholipid/cholesterol/gamma-HCH transport system substrate-binding protein